MTSIKNSKIITLSFKICYYYIMMHLTRYCNIARYMGLVDDDTKESDYDTYQTCLLKAIKKLKTRIITSSTDGSVGLASMSFVSSGTTASIEDNMISDLRNDNMHITNLKISE